ncbi:sensor histidine kinase [Dactylosporangium sp. NPDC005555]|uniref:sensor histidine kinase n=1 Tax=Dactylosporangium sp. NPDC005555 TaxID=3154889 RepID=UPI0033A55C3E
MRGILRRDVRPWDVWWELLPYPLLAGCAAAVARDGVQPWPQRWQTLAVAGLLAAWHWWMITAHPSWPGRLPRMAGYFAVVLGVTWWLLAREWMFLPVVVAWCGMAFVALPGAWAYAGAAGAALLSTAASDGLGPLAQFGMWAAWTAGASLFGAALRFMEDQVAQRHATVEELRLANARLVGLAGENAGLQARLLADARTDGVREERQRLAREIHDTLAQGLVAIVTQVEAAEEEADPSRVRHRLATVRELARDSLTEARRSVRALRPGALDTTTLPQAVTGTAERWSDLAGVPATVTVSGPPGRLHPEIEVAALRVVQEGLANVARHAAATRAGVTLTYLDDELLVDVRDDGTGFDPAATGGGFGLAGMRERVAALAGRLHVESAPGTGTALSAAFPAVRVEPS